VEFATHSHSFAFLIPMLAEPLTADRSRARVQAQDAPGRRGELALALQEAFTVAVRLRTKRQMAASADAFRVHVKQLLANADRQAKTAGYEPELVRLAIYAFVAFLDESVLNSQQPMFADWPRQPLQEEVFGDHVAGETFFRHLTDLMGRQDAEDVADVLEVHQLCLLLGFRGKYASNPAAVEGVLSGVRDKIRRIRGGPPPLSPAWALPEGESISVHGDPWLPRLAIGAGVVLLLTLAFYLLFRQGLGSAVVELGTLVSQLAR
jgi:type VI secretion system protein ImpK